MAKIKLRIVKFYIGLINAFFALLEKLLFSQKINNPSHILIFKIGNIGDTVCALPALSAIRNNFKDAHITLLSSPGRYGMPGARDFLSGSQLLNELSYYYQEDINSWRKIRKFIERIKHQKYDFLIYLPEDLASPKTVLRNLIFAKLIKVKTAIGFRINTTTIFKKDQVNNLVAPHEADRLMSLIGGYGIASDEKVFSLDISEDALRKTQTLLDSAFRKTASKILISMNPGGKRSANCWPVDRYRDLALYLHQKYGARIVVLGSEGEKHLGEEILSAMPQGFGLNACGALSILESASLLKNSALLISNSTGTIHIGAAVGVHCVGLYSIRDIPGKWSPYGDRHKVLCHTNLDCSYKDESCIKKSIDLIALEEAKNACDEVLNLSSKIS